MTTTEFYEGWSIMIIPAAGSLHLMATKNGRVMELGTCRTPESGIDYAKNQIDYWEKQQNVED